MNSSDDPNPEPSRPNSSGRPISRREAHLLAGQLSELTSGNLPVGPGLRAFAEELHESPLSRQHLRQHLLTLADKLEKGESVDQALQEAGAPRDLLFALRTGLETGHPDQTLADYVTYNRSSSDLWLRMLIGLAAPTLLLCLMIALFITVLVYLVPQFTPIFRDFGVELPELTMLMITLSDFVASYGWLILVGVVAGILALRIWGQYDPYLFPKIMRHVPLFGSINHFSTMSRLCYALGFMTENEVELTNAVRLAGEATNDLEMIRITREWAGRMQEGMSLEDASSHLDQLPLELIRTCQWESRPEILANSLNSLGSMYAARALNIALLVASLAEPLIIVLAGLMFFFTAVAMFLPLVKLLNDLS